MLQSLEVFHEAYEKRLEYLELGLTQPTLCIQHQVPQEFFLRDLQYQLVRQEWQAHLLGLLWSEGTQRHPLILL